MNYNAHLHMYTVLAIYPRRYILFYVLGGGCNRLALGPREDNFSALRRASLPQEAALGNLLGNVFALTSTFQQFHKRDGRITIR